MLDSIEIPQADILSDVVETVSYVASHPSCSDLDIAHFIGKVDRQGRYYRHAASLLGLITNQANKANVTELGQQLLALNIFDQQSFLRDRIMQLRVFQLSLDLIRSNPGSTEEDIKDLLISEGISESLSQRRNRTIVSWLLELGMIQQTADERLYIF